MTVTVAIAIGMKKKHPQGNHNIVQHCVVLSVGLAILEEVTLRCSQFFLFKHHSWVTPISFIHIYSDKFTFLPSIKDHCLWL